MLLLESNMQTRYIHTYFLRKKRKTTATTTATTRAIAMMIPAAIGPTGAALVGSEEN